MNSKLWKQLRLNSQDKAESGTLKHIKRGGNYNFKLSYKNSL